MVGGISGAQIAATTIALIGMGAAINAGLIVATIIVAMRIARVAVTNDARIVDMTTAETPIVRGVATNVVPIATMIIDGTPIGRDAGINAGSTDAANTVPDIIDTPITSAVAMPLDGST